MMFGRQTPFNPILSISNPMSQEIQCFSSIDTLSDGSDESKKGVQMNSEKGPRWEHSIGTRLLSLPLFTSDPSSPSKVEGMIRCLDVPSWIPSRIQEGSTGETPT